jgi:chaperonin cofactor prefoldin
MNTSENESSYIENDLVYQKNEWEWKQTVEGQIKRLEKSRDRTEYYKESVNERFEEIKKYIQALENKVDSLQDYCDCNYHPIK